ncbi:snaclec CHH-B subunit alpha, partial [Aplysia californica]|uniref:Snaclec CHH-B subunit alpha n=1 Tax=Aplysia californica TaxID=6500 RepID=A0ABM1VPN4_APLCA
MSRSTHGWTNKLPAIPLASVLTGLAIVAVLVPGQAEGAVTLSCPTGWSLKGNVCYKIFNTKRSWQGALDVCRQNGAELVEVKDKATNDFAGTLAGAQGVSSYWIGLNTIGQNELGLDTRAYWSGGEEWFLSQGFWSDGQPDTGDCVLVSRLGTRYRWSRGTCEQKRDFVCQFEACDVDSFRCYSGSCIPSTRAC